MGIFIFRAHKGTRSVSIIERNYSRGQKVQMVACLRSQLQPSALQFQSLANLKNVCWNVYCSGAEWWSNATGKAISPNTASEPVTTKTSG